MSDCSQKGSPEGIPFCIPHGLTDDRLREDLLFHILADGNFCNSMLFSYFDRSTLIHKGDYCQDTWHASFHLGLQYML